MKKLFKNKLFVASFIIIALAVTFGVMSAFSGGEATPVSNAVSIVLSPFEKAITAVSNGVGSVVSYITEFDALKAENIALNEKIRAMEADVREADKYKTENVKLREMLEIKQAYKQFDLEMAEVIARSDEAWSKALTIDKGSDDGIEAGDCVIVADGFVGFVSTLGTNWCEITTVTDTNMSAGVVVTQSRDTLVCEGNYDLMKRGCLKLSYITDGTTIYVGDTVETSGLGGLFPKGIMVGEITEINVEKQGLSKYAVVKPFVDTDKLATVFVVKDFEINN